MERRDNLEEDRRSRTMEVEKVGRVGVEERAVGEAERWMSDTMI